MKITSMPALKRLLGTAAAAAVAVGVGVLSTGTAHAATGDITMRIAPEINPFLYLGVANSSTGTGAAVIQWSLSGDEQVWTRRQVGTGAFEFVNKNSGLCLYADGVAGHWIYQAACDGSLPEQFSTNLPGAFGTDYVVRSRYNPALYWDIEGGSPNQGTHLTQWYYNGGTNQFFGALSAG